MGAKKIENDSQSPEEMIKREIHRQVSSHLEQLKILEKLDILKDENTIKALKGLEGMDWLRNNWKSFITKSVISLCLDFVKIIALVSVATAAVIYTIPTSHLKNIVPVLGYGDAPRVNAGLSLLASEVTPKDFDKYFKNIMNRIDREIALFYDLNDRFPGIFEYTLMEDLYGYDFSHTGVDIKSKVRTDMGNKLNFVRTEFLSRYEYDSEFWQKEGILEDDIEKMRSFKIFASQGQFVKGLAQLKAMKDPKKLRSYRFAVKWAFHQSYLDYKNELHEWIGKNI